MKNTIYILSLLTALILLPALQISAAASDSTDEALWESILSGKEKFKDAPAVVLFDHLETNYKDNGSAVTVEETFIHFRKSSAATDYRSLHYDFNPRTSNIRFLDVRIFHGASHTVEHIPLQRILRKKAPGDSIFWNFEMIICPVGLLEDDDALYFEIERRGLNLAYLTAEAESRWNRDFIPPQPGYFMDTLYFQNKFPLLDKTYKIRGPKTKPLQFAVANGALQAALKFDGDYLNYTFQVTDEPAYPEEPFGIGFSQGALKLALAGHPSWKMKSKWSYQHNEPQFIISPEMKAAVDEIIAGATDAHDKMFRLLHWVADEVRYVGLDMGPGEGHKVHPTDEIFRDRAGVCKDKAAVLVSMLRAAGFDAYFVMTLAMEQTLDVPADDKFNHGVVAVRLPDSNWEFLDPTWAPDNRPLFNYLEQEQPILIASPEGCDLKHIPYAPPEKSPLHVTAETSLNKDGSASIAMIIETDGYFDGRFRRKIGYYPRNMRSTVFQHLIEDLSPHARLTAYSFTDTTDFETPVKIKIQADIPDAADILGKDCYFTPLLAHQLLNNRYESDYLFLPASEKNRSLPVELACTRDIRFQETIHYPKGFNLQDLPPEITATSPTLDVNCSVHKLKKHACRFLETVKIKKRITPKTETGALFAAAKKLGEIQKLKLHFTREKHRVVDPPAPHSIGKPLPGEAHLTDTDAVFLERTLHLDLNPEGSLEETFHSRIKILNHNGRDDNSDSRYVDNEKIHSITLVEAVTETNGKKIPVPETGINTTLDDRAVSAPDFANFHTFTISFVGVENGSVLNHTLKRKTDRDWSVPFDYVIPLQDYSPTKSRTIQLTVPDSINVKYEMKGMNIRPVMQSGNGKRTFTWTFTDIPQYTPETNAGPWYRYDPVLFLTAGPENTWESRVAAFQKDFYSFSEADEALEKKSADLLENAFSDSEKCALLRDFVADDIQNVSIPPKRLNFRTRPVSRILETGYGIRLERLKLLAALIESQGGTFSVCFTGPGQFTPETAPCLSAFPIVFGRIKLGDFEEFIRLDQPDLPASRLIDRRVLVIDRKHFEWMNIPKPEFRGFAADMKLLLDISDLDSAVGKIEFTLADGFNAFDSIRLDTQTFIQNTLARFIAKPEITTMSVLEMAPVPDGKVRILCSFKGKPRLAEFAERFQRLRLPTCPGGFEKLHLKFPGTVQRHLPVRLEFPFSEKGSITVKYPDAWKIARFPRKLDRQTEFLTLRTRTTPGKKQFRFDYELSFPMAEIPPENYATLSEIWNIFTATANRSLIFAVKQHDPEGDGNN